MAGALRLYLNKLYMLKAISTGHNTIVKENVDKNLQNLKKTLIFSRIVKFAI